jgi:hypothetical protein
MQMQPESTSRASDGPVKTRHITSENSECEYVKKRAVSIDTWKQSKQAEGCELSKQMQPENTSRASDGPTETRRITSENSECEYVKKRAVSIDTCKQSKQAGGW